MGKTDAGRKSRHVDAARLREVFDYNPETGWLIERGVRHNSRTPPGGRAGAVNTRGYRLAGVDGLILREHRLIWVWMTGEAVPDGMLVDHVNGDPGDNRWCNLRLLTASDNTRNQRRARHYGTMKTKSGRFSARVNLGVFDTREEAVAALEAARAVLGVDQHVRKEMK